MRAVPSNSPHDPYDIESGPGGHRYGSQVNHGFTDFDGSNYNTRADMRSWQATISFLEKHLSDPSTNSPTPAATISPTASPTASWPEWAMALVCLSACDPALLEPFTTSGSLAGVVAAANDPSSCTWIIALGEDTCSQACAGDPMYSLVYTLVESCQHEAGFTAAPTTSIARLPSAGGGGGGGPPPAAASVPPPAGVSTESSTSGAAHIRSYCATLAGVCLVLTTFY